MVLTAESAGFPRFIEKGVEHIVLGWDHVVFLVILLLGARTLRDVAKFATVFTVAHSITLALALLGVVDVPGAIVEPLIAASIVYVAAAQVLGYEDPYKLYIVFGFGLLHGLGFAGAVTFPGGTPIVSALIGFNLGIELGQAMIIAVVFPLLLWTRRYEWSQARARRGRIRRRRYRPVLAVAARPRRLSRASCPVSGRVSASARPASGSAATIHITVSSPARSATTPNSAANDAADADREAERDAGRDPEPARQVLLPHHDADAERHHGHEADPGEQERRR